MIEPTVAELIRSTPPRVRPLLNAARRVVKAAAPGAEELAYRSKMPSSPSTMWKIARYASGGHNVVGIGTFPAHSSLWFYRGRELTDPAGLLAGSGKDTRFVTLRTASDAASPQVRALLRQAFRLAE